MAIRNFQCELTGTPCSDTRCKRGQCRIEVEEIIEAQASRRKLQELRDSYIRSNLQKEAESIARAVLKKNKKRLTAVNVALVSRMPRVQEIAKRNVEANAAIIFSG
jgi:hypothetical protein